MRRALPAALAAVAALSVPAVAGDDSTYRGGCRWESTTGTMAVAAVVYSEGTPVDNPVSATITCAVLVNGVTQVEAPFSGTGLVAGRSTVFVAAGETDVVTLCETVDYTSNATPTTTHCHERVGPPLVPQPVVDIVNALIDLLNECACEPIDPLCQVLPLLAGTHVPDVVTIEPEGDLLLNGELFWDCPPYDWSTE
jgi:hypothetical protein